MREYRSGQKVKFKCVRCELCCGTGPNVSITVYDLIRIARYLNVDPKAVLEIFMNVVIADVFPFITLGGDQWGRCVFLGKMQDGRTYCRIYEARPMRCRTYPALPTNLRGRFHIDGKCPGLGEDEESVLVSEEEAKEALRELKSHYALLYKLVVGDGLSPLEALYESLRLALTEVKVIKNKKTKE